MCDNLACVRLCVCVYHSLFPHRGDFSGVSVLVFVDDVRDSISENGAVKATLADCQSDSRVSVTDYCVRMMEMKSVSIVGEKNDRNSNKMHTHQHGRDTMNATRS